MKKQKYAVIGIGQFGRAIAMAITRKGHEVLAIDNDFALINEISEDFASAVALNATDKKALMGQDIQEYDAVVVAIGDDFESRLLCSANLLDLNVKRVITRANNEAQRLILEKMGVSDILSPEEEIGLIVAERMLNPSVINFLQLPDNHRISEIVCPKKCVNKSIAELDLRDKYKLSLITVKEKVIETIKGREIPEYHIINVPESSKVLKSTDRLVLYGAINDIDMFIDINE